MLKPLLLVFAALSLSDPLPAYNRRAWGSWRDADRDCQSTRQEVLIAESHDPVKFKTSKKCIVVEGLWEDLYTGEVYIDPRKLDIDHMVPLRHTHQSGGALWTRDKKRKYSNDLGNPNHLIAVSASANRSKGARSPDQWLPTNPFYRCQYIDDWTSVKLDWDLTQTPVEVWALEYMRNMCAVGIVPPLPQ